MMGLQRRTISSGPSPRPAAITISPIRQVDTMMARAIAELVKQDLTIESIAIWDIRSNTTEPDLESLKQKLITQLVNTNRFKVVVRDHLQKVIEEQSLFASGVIDNKQSKNIGTLIGADAFLNVVIHRQKDTIELHLSLISAKTGTIIWTNSQTNKS